MYVVVTYDCGVERVNSVRKFLKQYLNWVQNSVVEGELTDADLLEVKAGVEKLIDKDMDSVFFYKVKDRKFLEIDELGTRKADISEII